MSSEGTIAFKRITAFVIDYAVLAVYVTALTAASFALAQGALSAPAEFEDKLRGHAIAFATLTLPVVLYFSLMEASAWGATLGKRVRAVKVVTMGGARVSLGTALLRNVVKFLPWEIAHGAIWYVPGRPFLDDMPLLNLGLCIAAILLAGLYVISVLNGHGRAIYDRIAGTRVIPAE